MKLHDLVESLTVDVRELVKSQISVNPAIISQTLRKKFLFDEAIAVVEIAEIEPTYRKDIMPDYQRLLWANPDSSLEEQLKCSKIIYQCDLEAGVSKPLLLRAENGAWFIWKHENESDWAINNSAEIATFIVNKHLNLELVPFTFSKELNGVSGICQLWLHRTEMVFLNFPKVVDPISSGKLRLLDFLVFNRDRRSTNTLVDRNWGEHKDDSKSTKRIYAIDHGGAFYKRRIDENNFEKRPPEEVLSFVGARSISELFPTQELKDQFRGLDRHNPFSELENYISAFDGEGLAERVAWLQARI